MNEQAIIDKLSNEELTLQIARSMCIRAERGLIADARGNTRPIWLHTKLVTTPAVQAEAEAVAQ